MNGKGGATIDNQVRVWLVIATRRKSGDTHTEYESCLEHLVHTPDIHLSLLSQCSIVSWNGGGEQNVLSVPSDKQNHGGEMGEVLLLCFAYPPLSPVFIPSSPDTGDPL